MILPSILMFGVGAEKLYYYQLGLLQTKSILVHRNILLFLARPIFKEKLILFCFVDKNKRNDSEQIRRKKENQAIAQLLLVIGSFYLGFIPFSGKILTLSAL